ncbi:TPA_asm: transposase [Salmonella enterica subsp. enterica serovar Enteritidis]|uniref:Transposase n=5 Tax=Salmonella enterica TaxID=28901 RepID=A0A5Z1TWD8_SALET|nr:hypothetical protein [Salmonella enterica subsp. enterica serovar Enteritidis]EAM7675716.1 transposase [Salmonella enterica]EAZ4647071.1 transposase [Salmonella enterica subsp. enterica serovar Weltevreden]EBN0142034.1 transposase [Salmonella enterica subsp. enterica serovar Typhimurium]ECI8220349.1 transposase [Salmonella enterica subsp. enterica]EDB6685138.1 transposase [Salmonella enterica subsp. enterica serovar Infantis]EDD2843350.1 transposase [Salmonella enterica subsp. enterica ser
MIFTSTEEFKPREIMKLYSRRMQIEQYFRDEKSERFGFGLQARTCASQPLFFCPGLLLPQRDAVRYPVNAVFTPVSTFTTPGAGFIRNSSRSRP